VTGWNGASNMAVIAPAGPAPITRTVALCMRRYRRSRP
jgi:hypothetical protein